VSPVGGLDHELLGRVRQALADEPGLPSPGRVAAAVRTAGGVLGDVGLLDVVDAVQAELSGAGVLEGLLADPAVTDVLVNGAAGVWVDRGLGLVQVRRCRGRGRRAPPRRAPGCGSRTAAG
jgi:pilus assembly protein CpaF